ncbi:MAG: response regulator, partial [Litorilinea sp.]
HPSQPMSTTYEQFLQLVQDALNHLYDSPHLNQHALSALMTDNPVPAQRSQDMRRILLDAIGALRPKPGVPAQSVDWRNYQILELRYIEGLEPRDIMEQVALGKSQYYRDQARIVEMVAGILWEQWQQDHRPDHTSAATTITSSETTAEDFNPETRRTLAHSEALRLSAQAEWEEVDIAELLDELRKLVASLALTKQVTIHISTGYSPLVRRADRITLRQAILNAITYGLDIAENGEMHIGIYSDPTAEGIYIRAPLAANQASKENKKISRDGVGLEIGSQLMAALGGNFSVQRNVGTEWAGQRTEEWAGQWEARLNWTKAESGPLLVIDDNATFVDLFRRYLANSNWRVLGAASCTEARRVIAQTRPAVIILDVMMPKEDGWDMLRELRAQEDTRQIPVIICSVLNEPELALTLGARNYLPKPVTQQALLKVLSPWYQGHQGDHGHQEYQDAASLETKR